MKALIIFSVLIYKIVSFIVILPSPVSKGRLIKFAFVEIDDKTVGITAKPVGFKKDLLLV